MLETGVRSARYCPLGEELAAAGAASWAAESGDAVGGGGAVIVPVPDEIGVLAAVTGEPCTGAGEEPVAPDVLI